MRQPVIYLDPSVIGDAMEGRMRPRDRAAVCRLAAMLEDHLLSFYAPGEAKEAIARIPAQSRERHGREYAALRIFHDTKAGWLAEEPATELDQDPDYVTLRSLLGDPTDARHVLQARTAGVRDVVAADSSPLLREAGELDARLGLRVFRPADYLSRWSTQQHLPG